MLRIITGVELWRFSKIAETMFIDRAHQFSERLAWNVKVDKNGYERDQYDFANPTYVIISDQDGYHLGSMRLLPTTGPTMINDLFLNALGGHRTDDSSIWECTRFCLAPDAPRGTTYALLAAAAKLMIHMGVEQYIAIFDPQMLRVYRAAGVSPEIIGSQQTLEGEVFAGRWTFKSAHFQKLMRRAKLDNLEVELAIANRCDFAEAAKLYA